MFVVNVTFSLVAGILLTLVLVEAEIDASRGHLLASAEIATGRTPIWSVPAQVPAPSHVR